MNIEYWGLVYLYISYYYWAMYCLDLIKYSSFLEWWVMNSMSMVGMMYFLRNSRREEQANSLQLNSNPIFSERNWGN